MSNRFGDHDLKIYDILNERGGKLPLKDLKSYLRERNVKTPKLYLRGFSINANPFYSYLMNESLVFVNEKGLKEYRQRRERMIISPGNVHRSKPQNIKAPMKNNLVSGVFDPNQQGRNIPQKPYPRRRSNLSKKQPPQRPKRRNPRVGRSQAVHSSETSTDSSGTKKKRKQRKTGRKTNSSKKSFKLLVDQSLKNDFFAEIGEEEHPNDQRNLKPKQQRPETKRISTNRPKKQEQPKRGGNRPKHRNRRKREPSFGKTKSVDRVPKRESSTTSTLPTGSKFSRKVQKELKEEAVKFRHIREVLSPHELITYNEKTSIFEVNDRVVDLVKSIREDFFVLGIAGPQRFGKSFLLNGLLGHSGKGFGVSSGTRQCTRGIWIRINEVEISGERRHVVMLDTEGIGSHERSDPNFDHRIIALSILLSSLFIYNTFSTINHYAISQLSFISKMNEMLESAHCGIQLEDISPAFIWVVRDFVLEKDVRDYSGLPIENPTDTDYLSHCVRRRDGRGNPAIRVANEIREDFRETFPRRKCFCLPRPIDDDEKLRNLEDHLDELKEGFVTKNLELFNCVYSNLERKTFGGRSYQSWNGSLFSAICRVYCAAVNDNKLDLNHSFESIQETNNRKLMSVLIEEYEKSFETFSELFPVSCDAFHRFEDDLSRKLREEFRKDAIFLGDGVVISKEEEEEEEEEGEERVIDPNTKNLRFWVEKLNENFMDRHHKYRTANRKMAMEVCTSFIHECYSNVTTKLKNGSFFKSNGRRMFAEEKSAALHKYDEVMRRRYPKFSRECKLEFITAASVEEAKFVAASEKIEEVQRKAFNADRERQEALRRKRSVERKIRNKELEVQRVKRRAQEIKNESEAQIEKVRSSMQDQVDREIGRANDAEERRKRELENFQTKHDEEVGQMTAQITNLNSQLNQLYYLQNQGCPNCARMQGLQQALSQLMTNVKNGPLGSKFQ